jgi:TolB-like protein
MEELISEFKLGNTGLVDSDTAVQAGNMQGVEYLLTGSISQQGNQQRLDIKVISSASGKALYADAESGTLTTENVIFFARKTAYRLAEKWYGEENAR